jgi:hypothetical protein
MTIVYTWRKVQSPAARPADDDYAPLPDDRPPADYAAKASEAPPHENWP